MNFPLRVTDDSGTIHAWVWEEDETGDQRWPITACGADCFDWPVVLGGRPTCPDCLAAELVIR